MHEDVTLFRQPDHCHTQAAQSLNSAGSTVSVPPRSTNGTAHCKFGGMDASLMAQLKELEDDNRRLKKMYPEELLKAEIVQEVGSAKEVVKPSLTTRDGATNRRARSQHLAGLPGV